MRTVLNQSTDHVYSWSPSQASLDAFYQWDNEGKMTSVLRPGGSHAITYGYDPMGHLNTLTDSDDGLTASATYGPVGEMDTLNGTGVNGDNNTGPFPGEAFFNPPAGTLGVLQRRLFDGPWIFSLDLSALKTIKLTERQTVELRMDAFNAPNHPSFWAGDQNINANTFGVVAATFGYRVAQFELHHRF